MFTPVIGEIFKSSLTGKVYEVRELFDQMVVLHSLIGLNQVLTTKENINLFYKKMPMIGEGDKDSGR
jgi:hypothetical protein